MTCRRCREAWGRLRTDHQFSFALFIDGPAGLCEIGRQNFFGRLGLALSPHHTDQMYELTDAEPECPTDS